MKKIKDMHGKEIKEGSIVKKFGLINDDSGDFKQATVKHLLPMHSGGKVMVWAGSGGAHHPQACVVIDRTSSTDRE